MYDDSQNMITSYIPLYFIKSWKQGIQSDRLENPQGATNGDAHPPLIPGFRL